MGQDAVFGGAAAERPRLARFRRHRLQRRHVRPSERALRQGVRRLFRPQAAGARARVPDHLTFARADVGAGPSRAAPAPLGRRSMDYHFNFHLIWKHFDRLAWGLVLSLELAVVAIAIRLVISL